MADAIPAGFRPLKEGEKIMRPPGVDRRSGAPASVRILVGAAPNQESRLKTLQRFFPDAVVDPEDPENFIFTNPETGVPTLYNPGGLDTGDFASMAREGAQMIGGGMGATRGAAAGAPAGPVGVTGGAVVGAGLGATAADEAFTEVAKQAGMVDTRSGGERVSGAGTTALLNAGGQGAGMLLGKLGQAVMKRVLTGRSPAQAKSVIDDFGRVGETPSAGQATGNRALADIEGILSRMPGSSGQFAEKAQSVIDRVQDFTETRARMLASGREVSPEVAGRTVEKGIEGFVARFQSKGEAMFGALDKFVPIDSPVTAPNMVTALQKVAGPIQGAAEVSKTRLVSNPALKELLDAVQKDLTSGNGTIPYAVLKEIRTRLGRQLSNPALISDVDRGAMKTVYGAISDDMKAAARSAGPEAVKAFERANKFYKAGIQRIDDALSSLTKNRVPEKVFTAIEQGGKEGATRLRQIRRSLTEDEWRVVSGAVVRRLGKATASQQDEAGGVFSTETFLTNWNKLAPEAKDAMFGNMGSLRKDLDTVARISSVVRENRKAFANPSGTAGSLVGQTAMMLGTGGAAAGALTGNASMLTFAGVLALGALSANGAARLLTSPRFVKWLAEAPKLKPTGFAAHLGRLGTIAAASDPSTAEAIQEYLGAFSRKPQQ